MSLPDNTPVLMGAGQVTGHLSTLDAVHRSPQQLAADAAVQALADSGNGSADLVDAIAFVRTFADSVPEAFKPAFAPFGFSTNQPRSVAERLGCHPEHAILSKACGDEPQRLVAEFCQRISAGEIRGGIVCGAEAIASQRAMAADDPARPDWNESPAGTLEDRGQGIELLFDGELARHGAVAPVDIYPLLENARRHSLGLARAPYRQTMAELFARFAAVAHANPLAMSRQALSAADIATVNDSNRLIAEPYPKHMVARDRVNQGAAVFITSLGEVRRRGLSARPVFLYGHAHTNELPTLERPALGTSPAMAQAYREALMAAGVTADDIAGFDLYSCFPIAVFAAMEALGLDMNDLRPLTLTGGLPFFGGPGNNYSLHGIAEAVAHSRRNTRDRFLVGANGGYLSKHAVGIYGCEPAPLSIAATTASKSTSDVAIAPRPEGAATVETYTCKPGRGGDWQVIAIGRLNASGERFVATVAPEDKVTLQRFVDEDPLGAAVIVTSTENLNLVSVASSQ